MRRSERCSEPGSSVGAHRPGCAGATASFVRAAAFASIAVRHAGRRISGNRCRKWTSLTVGTIFHVETHGPVRRGADVYGVFCVEAPGAFAADDQIPISLPVQLARALLDGDPAGRWCPTCRPSPRIPPATQAKPPGHLIVFGLSYGSHSDGICRVAPHQPQTKLLRTGASIHGCRQDCGFSGRNATLRKCREPAEQAAAPARWGVSKFPCLAAVFGLAWLDQMIATAAARFTRTVPGSQSRITATTTGGTTADGRNGIRVRTRSTSAAASVHHLRRLSTDTRKHEADWERIAVPAMARPAAPAE